jgi:hypothetical protein
MFAAVTQAETDEDRDAALDDAARWAADTLRAAGVLPPLPAPTGAAQPTWVQAITADPTTPAWFRQYTAAVDWADPRTLGAWRKWLPKTASAEEGGSQDAHRKLGGLVRAKIGRDNMPRSFSEVDDYIRRLASDHPMSGRGSAPPLDADTQALRDALLPEIGRLQALSVASARERAQQKLEERVAKTLLRSAEYVRNARAYRASAAATGLARALQATIRDAEREALRAAAREAEEEAERKWAAAREAERAI